MKNIILPIFITLIVITATIVALNTNSIKPEIKTGEVSKPTGVTVPLPQPEDVIRNFIALINEKRPADAVSMMSDSINKDDAQKQAWAVQFNAVSSIKVVNLKPVINQEWTELKHTYNIILDVMMSPESASAPIPYYGWDKGENIRWITILKENNLWRIQNLATGP